MQFSIRLKSCLRIVIGVIFAVAVTAKALAQTYPSQPVRVIYPASTGSGIEAMVRQMATEVSQSLGQPFVVENRPGGSGMIGMNLIMGAPIDGSVIGVVTNGIVVMVPSSDSKRWIEPGKNYIPVTHMYTGSFVMAAHPSMPFRDVQGLISYAKANPGKLNATGIAQGSAAHLAWEMLKARAGIDIALVFYSSNPQGFLDVVSGRVDAIIAADAVKPHVVAGKLIGIATTGANRWSIFPDLPTMQEAGLPRFVVGPWYGIVVPVGTPAAVVAKLNETINAVINRADLKKKADGFGLATVGSSPGQFTSLIKSDLESWGPVIQKSGMKLD